MESFLFALGAVAPLFGVMVVGYALSLTEFFSDTMLSDFNRFVFNIALPCLLFRQSYQTDFSTGNGLRLPLFCVAFALVLVAFLWVLVPRFATDSRRASAIIQGVYRTNIALFGLPLAINLFGEQNAGDMVLIIALLVPLFNVIAVVLLSSFSDSAQKPSFKAIASEVLKNKLIWSVIIGLTVAGSHINVPDILLKPVFELGATATPLAMLSLGGQFSFKSAASNRKALAASCFLRLAAVPAVATVTAIVFGFTGVALATVFIVFGAPTASSSYIMAKTMGADGELAGEIVVFTTMMSVVTVLIGTTAFRFFGVI